jgi:hypothetical protein
MSERTSQERQEVYDAFHDLVNLQPAELEDWLETEESKSVGDEADSAKESTGHKSGRRIVEIKRTRKDNLSDADYDHMNKVKGYIKRHLAQRPDGDIANTAWRYSLMNWGHDPLRN